MDDALKRAIQSAVQRVKKTSSPPVVECLGESPNPSATVSESLVRVQTAAGSTGQFRRSPCAVLAQVLLLLHDGKISAVQRWCQFEMNGSTWLTETSLVFPDVNLRPWMLWSPWPASPGPFTHGRPAEDPAILDEWTRVDPALHGLSHGDIGDSGGAEQALGLVWDQGDASNDELDDPILFDIHKAVSAMGTL